MAAVPVTLPQLRGAVLHSIKRHSHEISTLITLAASIWCGKAISMYSQQALPSRKLSKPSQTTKTSGISCKAWTQMCSLLGDTSCEGMTNAKKKKNLSKYVSDQWNTRVSHFRNEALYIDSSSQHPSHENEGLFGRSHK